MKNILIGFGIAVAMFMCMGFTKYIGNHKVEVETVNVNGNTYIIVTRDTGGIAICPAK